MIRHARPEDRTAIRALLVASGLNSVSRYTYASLDGPCLVDTHEGVIRGVVRYFLGRPETWIRQVAVLPEHQGGRVASDLLLAVGKCAIDYGSEGVEGFVSFENPGATWMAQRSGAVLHAGTRVRWFADHPMWRQAAQQLSVGA